MPVLSFVSAMIKPGEDIRVAVNWAIENEFHGVEISARAFSPDPLGDEDIDWLVAARAFNVGLNVAANAATVPVTAAAFMKSLRFDFFVSKFILPSSGIVSSFCFVSFRVATLYTPFSALMRTGIKASHIEYLWFCAKLLLESHPMEFPENLVYLAIWVIKIPKYSGIGRTGFYAVG